MKLLSRRTLALSLLLGALSGCDWVDDDGFQKRKLAEARAVWIGKNVSSYSYVLELQCFCAPASQLREVLVTVTNGAPTSLQYWAEDPARRTPAPAEVFGPYDTVEELFEVIEDAIDRDADLLQVRYDQEYGFPDGINVDYRAGGSEQIAIFVSRFQPTAP